MYKTISLNKKSGLKFALAAHGGASHRYHQSLISAGHVEKKTNAMREALSVGHHMLSSGCSALDVVEVVTCSLEDSGEFEAGKGASYTITKDVTLDACIMNGQLMRAGSVAAIRNIKNPISVARAVMERTKHILLTSNGAHDFAVANGFEEVPIEYFRKRNQSEVKEAPQSGTVGVVARDRYGELAAATSTSGTPGKMNGRVGDSPIIGHGTYSNDQVAISCTGIGENFMIEVAAHQAACLVKIGGMTIDQAAHYVIHERISKNYNNEDAGMILVDKNGNVCLESNSPMTRGFINQDGVLNYGIHEHLKAEKL